jgi:hypothetical protein
MFLIVLMLEEGDYLLQIHLMAEETYLDTRKISRHEPWTERSFFVSSGWDLLHAPERDLSSCLSSSFHRHLFLQLPLLSPYPSDTVCPWYSLLVLTDRRRTDIAASGAVWALAAFRLYVFLAASSEDISA